MALVSGVSIGGVGWSVACELARRGATLILTGRDEGRLNAAIEAIRRSCDDDEDGDGVVLPYASLASPAPSLSSSPSPSSSSPSAVPPPSCSIIPLPGIDLSDLSSVRDLIDRVRALSIVVERGLSLIIHNAGVLGAYGADVRGPLTKQGVELTMATNFLAPFYITQGLEQELIKASKAQMKQRKAAIDAAHAAGSCLDEVESLIPPVYISRVIHVSSRAALVSGESLLSRSHRGDAALSWSFSPRADCFDDWASYAESKAAQTLHTRWLASRFDSESEVQSFAVHPGVVHTSIGGGWWQRLLCCVCGPCCFRSPNQGATPIVARAIDRSEESAQWSGEYFAECHRPQRLSGEWRDPQVAEKVCAFAQSIVERFEQQQRSQQRTPSQSSRLTASVVQPASSISHLPPMPTRVDDGHGHNVLNGSNGERRNDGALESERLLHSSDHDIEVDIDAVEPSRHHVAAEPQEMNDDDG